MSRESTVEKKIEKKAFFIGTCRRRSYYNMYPSDYLEDLWNIDVRRLGGYSTNYYNIKPKEILPDPPSGESPSGNNDLYYIPDGGSVDKFEFKSAFKNEFKAVSKTISKLDSQTVSELLRKRFQT